MSSPAAPAPEESDLDQDSVGRPDAAKLRRLRAEVFVATWLSYAGLYVTRRVFGMVKGPLKDQLDVNDLELSHLWTVYLVTYMLGQFLSAALGRRLSSRTLLLYGMGASVACNLAIGAVLPNGAGAYWLIMLLMGVHGIAQATGWPHNIAIVANWTRKTERGTVMAVWATCYQLGSVIAKALAAFTFGWLGLAWSFWGSSAVLVLITGLFFFFGHERPEAHQLPSLEEAPRPATPTAGRPGGPARAGASQARFIRMVLAMGLIYFGFKFLRYALDSWAALILKEHFALTTSTAGYLSTAFDWLGFLGVLVSGPVSDRLFRGARIPLIFVMAASCTAATVLLWTFGLSSVGAFVVLLGIIGFMAMGPDSLLSGAGAMDVGTVRQAAVAAGIINGVGSIGPIVQEPVIGWLKTYSGLDAVLFTLVVIASLATLGTGLFWYGIKRSRITL